MFKPNKTAVAGLICGLFVTSAALAQDATLPDSLTGDVSYSPNWDNSSDNVNHYALFKDHVLDGNNHNLTVSIPYGDITWTRVITAGGGDLKFSNIGTLKIEDKSTTPPDEDRTTDGLIYAQNSRNLVLDNIGTLDVTAAETIPIHGFGGTITVEAQSISLNSTNNAVMVQPICSNPGNVSLTASGDITIHSEKSSPVVAAVFGGLTASAALSLEANNITITSNSTWPTDAAVSIYDKYSNNVDPGQGTVEIRINARNTLSIEGASYGVRLNRSVTKSENEPQVTSEISAAQTISIHGGTSAMELSTAGASPINATVDAPIVDLVSDTGNAVVVNGSSNAVSSLAFGSEARSSQIFISGPEDQNAVELASDTSTVTFTNSSVEIASGDVASSGTITLNDTRVDLSDTSDFNTAVLAGASSEIVVNSAQTTVAAASNAIKDLRVLASGTYSDALGSPEAAREALASQLSINNAEGSDYLLGGEAGTVAGSWNETTDANGNKVIQATENASLEAIRQFNAMTLVQWRNENNHLSQRLGDVRAHRGALGTWARVYGYDSSVKDNINVDVKATSIQVGADTALGSNWIVGGAFSYTSMDGDFDNGSGESDGYSLAAYASGFFDCGGYVDVIGRVGRLSTDVTASTLSATGGIFSGSYDNTTLGLSVEAGYHWNPVSILYVEPQAELAYGYVLGDDFSSAVNGVTIEQDDFQSLVGRLGARIGATLPKDAGQIYMHVSINHDFLGDADATARPSAGLARSISTDLGGTWVSYGLGMQFEAGQNLSIYGSLDRANGSDYQEDYRYSVGVRYIW